MDGDVAAVETEERWRRVRELSGVEVSDHGRVRRRRPDGSYKLYEGHLDGDGRVHVSVQLGRGRVRYLTLAVAVLGAFGHEKPGNGYLVEHADGDRVNCRLDNLSWVPRRGQNRRGRTTRLCLRCSRPFRSWGPGNRMCDGCRTADGPHWGSEDDDAA